MQNKDYGLLAEAKEEGVPVVLARRRLGGWGKGGGAFELSKGPCRLPFLLHCCH